MDIIINVSGTVINTERLIIRPWKRKDLSDFYEYASVPGVGEMAGWPHHESKNTTKYVSKSFMEVNNVFAIEYRENGKVIGSIGFHLSWANEDPEYKHLRVKDLGYSLSKDYWGRGLTPEAAMAVIEWVKNNYDIDALTCGHFRYNTQSKRVIEKCGFTFVRESTYHARQLNAFIDDAKYIKYL